MKKEEIKKIISAAPARSAWTRGVKLYALELLENLPKDAPISEAVLLNGATNWKEYSYGGCALIYDVDIAERLCSPSELRRVKGGDRLPNRNEMWLDVQARALAQAAYIIITAVKIKGKTNKRI